MFATCALFRRRKPQASQLLIPGTFHTKRSGRLCKHVVTSVIAAVRQPQGRLIGISEYRRADSIWLVPGGSADALADRSLDPRLTLLSF